MWELSAGTAGSGIMAQLEQFGVRKPTIVFDTDASGASGFAGCNTFQGSYKAGDSAIHLGPFAVTRRACPGMADIETPFLRALAATRSYHVSANSLEFLGEDGTILLSFAPRSN
jgi:putative lipoprotein